MGTANHVRGTYYVYCTIYIVYLGSHKYLGASCNVFVFACTKGGPSDAPFQGLPVHKLTLFSKLFNKSIRLPTPLLQYYVL